jgi:lipopolysaccharide assembly protein A
MRLISLVILVAAVVAVVVFALENSEEVTVHFFGNEIPTTMAKLVGAAYALGMVSGWTVIGVLRRSWARVTAPAYREPAAR